jgi:hypothetical protein
MKNQAMIKPKEMTNSKRKMNPVEPPPMNRSPMMTRAVAITHQVIQTNNLPLRLKTPNSRK